jgi:membrane protein required for colicin V production
VVPVVHGTPYLRLGEQQRELHDASMRDSIYEHTWLKTEEPVHWFDMSLTIALILSGAWGCLRGLVRALLSLLGLVAATILAVRGYADIAQRLAPFIATPWVQQAVGFALIFLAVMAVAMLCSALLRFALQAAGLSLLDRLLGGFFGLAKVILVVSVLLMMANTFFPSVRAQLEADSTLAPFLFRSADLLAAFLEKQDATIQHLQRQIR